MSDHPLLSLVQEQMRRAEACERLPALEPQPDPPPRPPLVPPRFTAARFESFTAETDTERYALRSVERWVELVVAGQWPMLALVGPQGTGKSHLLYAASWALHVAGTRSRCFSWYKLADELRYGSRNPYNGAPLEPQDVRTGLWAGPVILLDEVRPTAGTSFDDTELAKLACHCYDSQLPVLLTTNVSPLSDVLGPAAASRYTQVTITGRDRRQTSRRPGERGGG